MRALFLIPLLALFACSRGEESSSSRTPPVSVSLKEVRAQEFPLVEEIVGTVTSQVRTVLEAKVSGAIRELRVQPGTKVHAGDILIQLDTRELKAKFEQASALLRQSEADLERMRAVLASRAVSRQEFDAAEAKVALNRGIADEAKTMLGYATITAPFDGVVTRKLTELGDLAGPGKPLLELERAGGFRVETYVPESLISAVVLGESLAVRIGENTLSGVVQEVAPSADPATRSFLVKVDLPSGVYRAGQFARVRISYGKKKMIVVPESSIIRRGGLDFVFVAREDRAVLRLVRIGKAYAEEVEILSGLEAGENIVLTPGNEMRDGEELRGTPS